MNAVTQVRAAPPAWLQESADAFLARHDELRALLPGDPAQRAAGAEAFRRRGLPGIRDEAWHYTSLRALAETRFFPAPVAPHADPVSLLAGLPGAAGPRLVFIDGRVDETQCEMPLHAAVRVGRPAYGSLARPDLHGMVALNAMLAADGASIDVAAGVDAGTILLVSLGAGTAARPVAFHPRHRVRLGSGAKLVVLEVSLGEGAYLHNPVFEMSLAERASLTHLRLQDESPDAFHLSTVYADIATKAAYDSFALTVGARMARMEVHARLTGEGAAAHVNAAQLLAGGQHADFTTVISHDAPSCASRQTVKNVLTDRARGVFQGKIAVARAAQKTDGYQMNQALLLSPDAEIDSKPELEIFADDVKCSHGATVGELDAEQLFYLRSRGIPQADARALLVRAFLAEALDPISHEAGRTMLEAAVDGWWMRQST